MKPVLFVSYGGVHVNALLPVAKSMHDKGIPVLYLALTTARKIVEEASIPVLKLEKCIPEDIKEEVSRLGEILFKGLESQVTDKEQSIAYLGWSMYELILEYGEAAAWAQYDQNGRGVFFQKGAARHLLSMIQPAMLVTTNSPRMELAHTAAAAELKVPCIIVNTHPVFCDSVRNFKTQAETAMIYVLSDAVKSGLVEAGIPSGRIIVSGLPQYDYLTSFDSVMKRQEVRASMGVGDEDIVILVLTQPDSQQDIIENNRFPSARLFQSLEECTASSSRIKWFVRPHPSQKNDHFPNIAPMHRSLPDMLAASDVVLSKGSTALIDAIILGKPIIYISHGESQKKIPPDKLKLQCMLDIGEQEGALINAEAIIQALAQQRCVSQIRYDVTVPATKKIGDDICKALDKNKTVRTS